MTCVQYGHIQKKDKESQWVPCVRLQCSEMRLKFKVFYVYMGVLPPRMFVYHEHAVSWGQKSVRCPEIRVRDRKGSTQCILRLISGSQGEQPVLLTTEPTSLAQRSSLNRAKDMYILAVLAKVWSCSPLTHHLGSI